LFIQSSCVCVCVCASRLELSHAEGEESHDVKPQQNQFSLRVRQHLACFLACLPWLANHTAQ